MSETATSSASTRPRRLRRRRVGGDGRAPAQLGVTRALVVCDAFVSSSGLAERLQAALVKAGVESVVFDRISGEPSEDSVAEAARGGPARLRRLHRGRRRLRARHREAVRALRDARRRAARLRQRPDRRGTPVPGPVLPLVALPTTSGTGSEVTTVAVVDFPRLGTKTGVSHRYLRPSLAIVDPALTVSCPPGVTASTGIDALMHALEAYTVSAYDTRAAAPARQRPPYQGANPFSDPLCERAIELVGEPSPHSSLERRRPRVAHRDGAGVDGRRYRVLGRRRAHPARPRLSDRVAQARVAAAGLRRRCARAARLRGRGDRACRVPLHRRRRARAVRNRGTAAGRRRRPRGLARAADGGRRRTDDGSASSATGRTTSHSSWRARSTSAGSSWARRRTSVPPSSRPC